MPILDGNAATRQRGNAVYPQTMVSEVRLLVGQARAREIARLS